MKEIFFILLVYLNIQCMEIENIQTTPIIPPQITNLLGDEITKYGDKEILQIIEEFANLEQRKVFFNSQLDQLKKEVKKSKNQINFFDLLKHVINLLSDIMLCIPEINDKCLMFTHFKQLKEYSEMRQYQACLYFCKQLLPLFNQAKNPVHDEIIKILDSPVIIYDNYEGYPYSQKSKIQSFHYYILTSLAKDYVIFCGKILEIII